MANVKLMENGIQFGDGTSQNTASSSPPTSTTSVIAYTYTSPATWTKPSSIRGIRVTIFGAGGNGGSTSPGVGGANAGGGGSGGTAIGTFSAPAIPGPIAVTVGVAGSASPSTFGPLISATAGGTAANKAHGPTYSGGGASGGTGTGGQLNFNGLAGAAGGEVITQSAGIGGSNGWSTNIIGMIGGSPIPHASPGSAAGAAQGGINGGGGGGSSTNPAGGVPGGAGGSGYIIVEEFY